MGKRAKLFEFDKKINIFQLRKPVFGQKSIKNHQKHVIFYMEKTHRKYSVFQKSQKSRETNTFYYKFCETSRLKISMVKGQFFQRQNLDVKRPKNYFCHLFFTKKNHSKSPVFLHF